MYLKERPKFEWTYRKDKYTIIIENICFHTSLIEQIKHRKKYYIHTTIDASNPRSRFDKENKVKHILRTPKQTTIPGVT